MPYFSQFDTITHGLPAEIGCLRVAEAGMAWRGNDTERVITLFVHHLRWAEWHFRETHLDHELILGLGLFGAAHTETAEFGGFSEDDFERIFTSLVAVYGIFISVKEASVGAVRTTGHMTRSSDEWIPRSLENYDTDMKRAAARTASLDPSEGELSSGASTIDVQELRCRESLGKPCDELEEGEIGKEESLSDIRREASLESEQTLYQRTPKSEYSGCIMSVDLVKSDFTAKLQVSQDSME